MFSPSWPGVSRPPAPDPVGPPRRLYNRRCVGGRDTPGHDDLGSALLPQPLTVSPTTAYPDAHGHAWACRCGGCTDTFSPSWPGVVPATRPRLVGPPRRLYNRRCAGGRDTPAHDDFGEGPSATTAYRVSHNRLSCCPWPRLGMPLRRLYRHVLSVMAGRCPGHPPPAGGAAAEAVQPPVRGWPGHARPRAHICGMILKDPNCQQLTGKPTQNDRAACLLIRTGSLKSFQKSVTTVGDTPGHDDPGKTLMFMATPGNHSAPLVRQRLRRLKSPAARAS